jgi:hypothetical protein
MANFRTISPSFWSDPFVEELTPSEKLLYFYLFSNEHVSNIGVTEASIRKMAFETGVDVSSVSAFIGQMSSLGKVVQDGGQILAVNFIRNQTKFGKDKISEKLAANLQRLFDELESPSIRYTLWKRYPDVFSHVAEVEIPYPRGIDTVSKGMDTLSKGYQPEKSAADTLGINRKVESSNRKEEIENINSASGDAPRTHDSTQKPAPKPKATLEGKRLESFERFWDAFGYKKGRGGAEKAWAAIPTLTDSLVEQICEAARKEATQRPALEAQGRTPKWAQGWLNERRWEDDYEAPQPQARPAFQPHGQQKTWAEISDEKMKQDCLKGMYDYMDTMGIPHEENDDADEHPRDQWTAEVIND